MRTLIVTDSTAYIPVDYAAKLGIEIVPLQVLIGDKSYEEGGEGAEAILTALRQGVMATTSKPTPERFLETYRRAAATGYDAVVSIHLSKAISGTYDSALVAASQASIPVHVVDSKSLAMGLGFAAISAAHAGSVDLAIHHLGALDLAHKVSDLIQGGLAEDGLVSEVIVSEVGAVVGAHTGPGMIAVVISPRI
ncbi:MAG: DegV family EDD domain-containing protein [Actinobacteria bacterium]|nr:DegV family EDD domain-containing protein [Actinomycetota bacterium]